jgi:hypothetical protein
MAKKKMTGDDLSARAQENSYQRSIYQENKDNLRDQNKYINKIKRDQNIVLNRYIL